VGEPAYNGRMASAERLAQWMRGRVHSAGARGLAIGLSGGVDSAVVARLAQLAVPGAALGVLLPCHGDSQDEKDALSVAQHFSLPTLRCDLSPAYDALVSAVQPVVEQVRGPRTGPPVDPVRGRTVLANTKPRLRMTALYIVASSLNYLVAGTGNRSELAIGYFTKWGDGGVDLLPLGRLMKSQVRALAQELRVPQGILDRTPSAGLWIGQRDEDEMGFTYAELERYLAEGPTGVAPALAVKIERLVRSSEHKREMPPAPDFD
jgi:NAD+ synthase